MCTVHTTHTPCHLGTPAACQLITNSPLVLSVSSFDLDVKPYEFLCQLPLPTLRIYILIIVDLSINYISFQCHARDSKEIVYVGGCMTQVPYALVYNTTGSAEFIPNEALQLNSLLVRDQPYLWKSQLDKCCINVYKFYTYVHLNRNVILIIRFMYISQGFPFCRQMIKFYVSSGVWQW